MEEEIKKTNIRIDGITFKDKFQELNTMIEQLN